MRVNAPDKMRVMKLLPFFMILVALSCCSKKQTKQNPSPMEEHIRPHHRVDGSNISGSRVLIEDIFEQSASLFIPNHLAEVDTVSMLIHFHGSADVTEYAAEIASRKLVVLTVNLGSGSSRYEQPFLEKGKFAALIGVAKKALLNYGYVADQIILSGFSAGYGALRAILSNPDHVAQVSAAILLDGLHTDYIPDGKTLYEGGKLNTTKLDSFLSFAQLAVQGKKKFLFTHSSIFPGTYASTTECADYLINKLGLIRNPVLGQGPLGMQLLSATEQKGLKILAFAGNTAPDHIDHLHGLHAFVDYVIE